MGNIYNCLLGTTDIQGSYRKLGLSSTKLSFFQDNSIFIDSDFNKKKT